MFNFVGEPGKVPMSLGLLTWVLALLARIILVLVGHRDNFRFVVRTRLNVR